MSQRLGATTLSPGAAPAAVEQPGAHAAPATALDYVQLMKPRVMALVVFTALVGLVAAPLDMHPLMAATSILAVALGSGAAGALNMWYDADIDARMARTADRPVPAGRVARDDALAFGLIVSGLAILLMWLAANAFAAALLAFSIFFYAVIYTMWLKRRTAQNIVIGGAAGAFPPVIGWVAATGEAPLDAWLLFGVIFLWTPPHFWALSLWAARDYERVGVPMLPVVKGPAETRRQILVYALIFVAFSFLPMATGLGGWLYLAVAATGGGAFVWLALRVYQSSAGDKAGFGAGYGAGDQARGAALAPARALFGASIILLFALFLALLVEHGTGVGQQSPASRDAIIQQGNSHHG